MDRGGGFDIGASGTFALVVGLLKVKFVSGGTRFMSRKFRETKPSDPPLEIAQSLRRGLVMGDGWIAVAVAANLAMDHKQTEQVAVNGAIVPSMDADAPRCNANVIDTL